nr:anti-phage dCTP deaminase [uncultured Vibrio sp.]
MNYVGYKDSELVIGLVGAVGVQLDEVSRLISERLKHFNYNCRNVKVSKDVIQELNGEEEFNTAYDRIDGLMTAGNNLRSKYEDKSILAKGIAAKISHIRSEEGQKDRPLPRNAFIINSLKTPEEVKELRKIYANGFFLVGVYSSKERRLSYLQQIKNISEEMAKRLMTRDKDESDTFGQKTRDTYHLSDFFINQNGDQDKQQNDIWRILNLVFGHPFITPTFDEYSMFMAFSSSLRSADLSRQVGAVIAKDDQIISTGANDVPKAGGGLYWPTLDEERKAIIDHERGRDYTRGFDSNKNEQAVIIEDIMSRLSDTKSLKLSKPQLDNIRGVIKSSKVKDITEYGRIVHAEMEAILSCARHYMSTKDATLYCTTFPCHNCAKHIVAAGIKRVVYVEPYPKSKATVFHSDAISFYEKKEEKVTFEPFVGVGPRSFFKLFSLSLGSGDMLKRKDKEGNATTFDEPNAKLRMQMLPSSYLERERFAASVIEDKLEENK